MVIRGLNEKSSHTPNVSIEMQQAQLLVDTRTLAHQPPLAVHVFRTRSLVCVRKHGGCQGLLAFLS